MIKIAITGNIASGKSTVEKIISDMGFLVIDTDTISHNLIAKDKYTIDKIKKAFETYDILDENGNIIRYKIGQIIFNNKILKTKLESIIHPKIKDELQKIYNENQNEKIIFVSVPLLFEAKFDDDFDKIILVAADENTRKIRLLDRNNYSLEHAHARIKSQLSQEEKIKLSDYIIYNNSDVENLEKSTVDIISKIKSTILQQ